MDRKEKAKRKVGSKVKIQLRYKESLLRYWAISQKQSSLQHGVPDHPETERKGAISTGVVGEKTKLPLRHRATWGKLQNAKHL